MGSGGRGEGGAGALKEVGGQCGQAREIVPEVVAGEFAFDEAPDPFDQVELRGVRGQPKQRDPLVLGGEPSLHRWRFVVGGIIEHQHQLLVGPVRRQLREKLREVLPRGTRFQHRFEVPRAVIKRPEHR